MTIPLHELPVITAVQVAALRAVFTVVDQSTAETRTEILSDARAKRTASRVSSRITWNGNTVDLARDMSAVRTLDFNARNSWRNAANAIAKKYGDHAPAWAEWEAWASQWVPTEPITQTNPEMRAEALTSVASGKGVGMGAVIADAMRLGWHASLSRWPGIAMSTAPKADDDGPTAIAGSYVAREAHAYAALTDTALRPIDFRVLCALHLFWSSGDAWPSFGRLEAITGHTRDKIARSITMLEGRGYLRATGYIAARKNELRNIEFTSPEGKSWDNVIADRNYGRGCSLDRLAGARCPNAETVAEYSPKRVGGEHSEGGSRSNGRTSTDVGDGGQADQRETKTEGEHQQHEAMMPVTSESEWASIIKSMGSDCEPTAAVGTIAAEQVETTPERVTADQVDPDQRSSLEWLQSSAVPISVSAIVINCRAEKQVDLLGSDLLRLYVAGVDPMDISDAMLSAINSVTWSREHGRNFPLDAIPRRKPTEAGRTTLTSGETLARLREHFVVQLDRMGIHHPDAEAVKAERAYRKSRMSTRQVA